MPSRPKAGRGTGSASRSPPGPGRHLILFPRGGRAPGHLKAFIRSGLEAKEKVVLIIPQGQFARCLTEIQQDGLTERLKQHSEQVALLLEEEVVIEAERIGQGGLKAFIEEICKRSLQEGWRGLRFVHMGQRWDVRSGEAWEGLWEELKDQYPITVLCAYDVEGLPESILRLHSPAGGKR